jgi:L-tartrate/succinate antiporter
MFVTALAPNLLALELVGKIAKESVSWSAWLAGFLPVGVVLLLMLPFLVYRIYPPEIKSSPEAPSWAEEELKKIMLIDLADKQDVPE